MPRLSFTDDTYFCVGWSSVTRSKYIAVGEHVIDAAPLVDAALCCEEDQKPMCAIGAVVPSPLPMQFLTQPPPPSFHRAILHSIEKELRPDTADDKAKASCPSVTVTPAGPVIVVASTTTSEPVEGAGHPNATSRRTISTRRPCLPAGPHEHTDSKPFQRPRFQATPASRVMRKSQGASRKFDGSSRSQESSRLVRAGLAMGADFCARSVGTVVAHYPTAVASRSMARGRKSTKRAWG